MKVNDIVAAMEHIAPLSISKGVCEKFGDYDNSGLLMDFCRGPVEKVLVALDASMSVMTEAVSLGVQMIVTHHPIIYTPLKSVGYEDVITRKILIASEHRISVYSAHLNLDSAEGGINEEFARACGLSTSRNLCDLDGKNGYLRLGELDKSCALGEYRERLAQKFGPFVRAIGNPESCIERVAAVNGGGAALYERALRAGADCFISGDFRHHEYKDAIDNGLCLVEIPHYDAEKFYMSILTERLTREVPGVRFIESGESRPFWN